jgi:chromosomal replication initiator protein
VDNLYKGGAMEGEINLERKWLNVLSALKISVSEASFNAYLKSTQLVQAKAVGERLVCDVVCPSAFIKDTVEKRFWGQMSDELTRVMGKPCELKLVVSTEHREDKNTLTMGPLFESNQNNKEGWKKAKLREDYTFENYAVGGSNQMAYAAAQAVSKRPGEAYNPLFIYGGVGVGKTHLMQAIGHEVTQKGEDRVLFCSGEEFTNDLVEAIRFKGTEKVRAKYRKMKLLLIDDVQFIAGKPSVQEEFFHTFNTISREGGQVVMTSDKPPSEISKLEERLRSRFGAGLIVDIGQPDFELRTAILLIKSRQKGIELDMSIAQTIATHIEGIRELQGFLVRLLTESELKHQPITREKIEGLLKISNSSNNQAKIITPAEVMASVGNFYGVAVQQLKGERRTKTVAWPRQILMYILTSELRLPLEEVGRLLGGRDHTTVMHARDKVVTELETNEKFRLEFGEVKKKIYSFN